MKVLKLNIEKLKRELKESGFDNPTNTDAFIFGMWKDMSNKLSWIVGFSAGFGSIVTGLLIAITIAIF